MMSKSGAGRKYMLMQKLFAEAGITLRTGRETGNSESIKRAAMAGLGVALKKAAYSGLEKSEARELVYLPQNAG